MHGIEWFKKTVRKIENSRIDWDKVISFANHSVERINEAEKVKSLGDAGVQSVLDDVAHKIDLTLVSMARNQNNILDFVLSHLADSLKEPFVRGRIEAAGLNPADEAARLEVYSNYPKKYSRHIIELNDALKVLYYISKSGNSHNAKVHAARVVKEARFLKVQQRFLDSIAEAIIYVEHKSDEYFKKMQEQALEQISAWNIIERRRIKKMKDAGVNAKMIIRLNHVA